MAHPTDDKNFRLSPGIRPSRYIAEVTLDFDQKGFEGKQRIELTVEEDTSELVLHAVDLAFARVSFRSGTAAPRSPSSIRLVPVSGTAVFSFDAPLPRGSAVLELEWSGKFSQGLRGLYFAGGVAATQFEAADARRLFPCFDEPAFKARWALSARVPPGHVALSNGESVKDETEGKHRKVTFRETELLSSYLIALVCGPLTGTAEQRAGDVPIRTWSVRGKEHLTRFGQEAALAALPRLQEYFGLPYAFGKVDQVGLPEFEAGAMENAGLITYRETALLLDQKTAPLAFQKGVAETVTHELAHQWFGNWVTMVWWDDLWLNEAFATWMAYKIVDGWRPAWRVWLDFDKGKAVALGLDALRSTHPIRGVVRNADEAGESFDVITYEKGGAVLRMIEGFLSEAAFREGIRLYMRQHAKANAVADDLWAALAKSSSAPVVELANAWIRQSGYPVVAASVRGSELKLSQRRFYSEPGVQSAETWPVPLVLRYEDGNGIHERRLLFKESEATVQLPAEPRWICVNAGSTGFYRVNYDEQALARLAGNLESLAPAERIGLLADQWALVRSGQVPIAAFLSLVAGFGQEEDDAVLDELVARLGYVEQRLTEGEAQERFRGFIERLLAPQLAKVGWDAAPGETDGQRLRRAALVRAVGALARSGKVLEEARPRVAQMLAGKAAVLENNLLDPALQIVARSGDAALFDLLQKKFPSETEPPAKRRYLLALASFEDPKLNTRAQELLFKGFVPMQDTSFFVSGLLANRVGRDAFWARVQARWTEVLQLTGKAPMLLRRIVEATGNLRERRHLEEATAFFAAHPLDEVRQAVAQTLERLAQDVALKERVERDVADWLRQH